MGFMGSGKSTLGKELARSMGIQFIDLDQSIERSTGLSVTDLFKTKGEQAFRSLESAQLKSECQKDRFVMALGGGTPCFNDNLSMINNSGTSFYLDYNAETLAERLKNISGERPLLKDKSGTELMNYITALMKERAAYYNQATFIIKGGERSIQDMILEIKKKLS